MEYTTGECSVKVYPNERLGAFFPNQCQKKAIVERDGKLYCKIHDPEYIKEKRKKWQEKFDKEWAEKEAGYKRGGLMRDACEGLTIAELQKLNPNLLRGAPDLYEACKLGKKLAEELLRITGLSTIYHLDVQRTKEQIEQALAKAERN